MLEKLSSELFQPLSEEESAMVLGGLAKLTFKGLTELNSEIYNDYTVE